MVAFFKMLEFEGFAITDSSRLEHLHSDRAGEFTVPLFARFLVNHKTIYHTFTFGYDLQANGTAERAVGLIKTLAARVISTTNIDANDWSYATRYESQALLCHALQRRQQSLPLGCGSGSQL